MKRFLTGIAFAVVFVALVHTQAEMTGKWQGVTRSGAQLVLDLTATESTLTGTLTYNGQPATISDGKVSKNTFTFKATLDGEMEGFAGELAGDQITFWPDRLGRPRATVLKRVAAVTGKWQGETRNKSQIVLDLTATETTLTGTLTRNGQPATIVDGKVSKDTLTFKATLDDQTEGFTGELAGDQITVWLDRLGRPSAAVLKRAKE
jgi:hypothetical protein